jgi:hypothetical protein|tara:strand:+ start:197 stop:904 length:708 start_codon:yes stop_codon:yes gene_type:complete
MALPRVNTPNYSLELPSTGKTIKYRPFLVKEQKILLMAQDSGNEEEVADAMGKLVASCTYGDLDPALSPMFDLEYVFLNIRCKSVGSKVKVVVTCPDDEETKVPVEIDLEKIDVNMLDNHSTEIQITDEVKVNFRYPILKDMKGVTTDSTELDKVFHVMNKCISNIEFGDDIYQRSDISEEELNNFIDELTSEQFEKIVEFFNTMPKLRHTIEVTNPKTKVKSEVVLEGLESFLE